MEKTKKEIENKVIENWCYNIELPDYIFKNWTAFDEVSFLPRTRFIFMLKYNGNYRVVQIVKQ